MKKAFLVSAFLISIFISFQLSYSAEIPLTQAIQASKLSPSGNTFYISPAGNDSNSGTSTSTPWKTFNRAWLDLYPGDTLILMDGVYYQRLNPNKRNGQPGNPITIRAQNDGKAIIDGQYQRIPVKLGDTWPGPIGDYFVIEGIIAQNSSSIVYMIQGDHNILRRVSGKNANTDDNTHVFVIWADYNLLEDCVASGTGRKMIMSYQGDHNIIRRCFAYWKQWDGRNTDFHWPWGNDIEIYHGNNNIIENSISYGPTTDNGIGIQANASNATAIGNKVLGTISINAGMNVDGTVKYWGCPQKPEPCGPEDRPQPTTATLVMDFNGQPNLRSGFALWGQGEVRDNLFQDIFAWGNAGLGFSYHSNQSSIHPNTGNNSINRATIIGNGLDQPCTPAWPCKGGGNGTNMLQLQLDVRGLNPITNSYIENIFVGWPTFPNGQRNFTSMNGEGARLTNRYVNGVLTNQPLWPWPMEGRIQAELGISVAEKVQAVVENLGAGFTLTTDPPMQMIDPGETTTVSVSIQPTAGFTQAVTLSSPSPSPDLTVSPPSTPLNPPNQVTLTLTDKHAGSYASGLVYTIPITATGGGVARYADIFLIVNGKQAFTPVIMSK